MPVEQKTPIADDLGHEFEHRFGNDWRRTVSVTVNANILYWIVHFAELGILYNREESKSMGIWTAESMANDGLWTAYLQSFVDKIKSTSPPKKGKG